MVVEHQFVTVLDGPIALAAGQAFFEDLGFTGELADDKAIQLRRGKKTAPGALSLSVAGRNRGFWGNYDILDFRLLPQQARMEFDRGRVTVAVSLVEVGKKNPLIERMLLAAASGLEMVLVGHAEIGTARESWDRINNELEEQIRKRKRRGRIALLLVVLLIVVPLFIFAMLAIFVLH